MANTNSAKLKKKKSSGGGGASAGLKGFGSSSSSAGSNKSVTSSSASSAGGGSIDRSLSALKFYDYIERNGGGTNLKRVGLGNFPIQIGPTKKDVIQLRGVIALRNISKGETIIEIPYEMAIDLGRESADPTLPATTLLQKYCTWRSSNSSSSSSSSSSSGDDNNVPPGDNDRGDYFAMLPTYMSDDCLGSTDFFSDVALGMLQSPMVVEETLLRRELVQLRYERDVEPMAQISSNLYRWNMDEIATQSHLQWASWIITSRVLTVQGAPESSSSYRLLIPLIDMCNHDRDSPHILTGRAMPGGMLKVVAGADVMAGEAINIGYGGGVEGNDRFIQDYGFLDGGGSKERGKKGGGKEVFVPEGYKIVARKLLGKVGTRSITKITAAESERALKELGLTTLDEDEKLLASGTILRSDERMALEYRIGIKQALKEFNDH
jgi:hypothetical protein